MNRVAVVTGTSSGMGLHAALALAKAVCTVVATVRSKERAVALEEAAAGADVTLDIRELDVTDHAANARFVEGVVRDHGRLDVLVNNAGRGCVGTAETLPMETVRGQLETNYFSVVALTQAVLPHMREARRGTIVTVTSVGGVVGQPFADAYCAAKFAVEGFMQSLSTVAAHVGVRERAVGGERRRGDRGRGPRRRVPLPLADERRCRDVRRGVARRPRRLAGSRYDDALDAGLIGSTAPAPQRATMPSGSPHWRWSPRDESRLSARRWRRAR